MLDYKLIEALASVIQEKGFDKAGHKLHLTQSAISQRIKLLEDQTGQILLKRTSPPQATNAGAKVLKHYLQTKRLEDELRSELQDKDQQDFTTIAIGLNADSLATWFLPALQAWLASQNCLLDLYIDDQEQTHHLLQNGQVMGCISTRKTPVQGCTLAYLGQMEYRLVATPSFRDRWFPQGLQKANLQTIPMILFNRKDRLNHLLLKQLFDPVPTPLPTYYVPSSERFAAFLLADLCYGMLPDLQSAALLDSGELVNLAPHHTVSVPLYWHSWNLRSQALAQISRCFIEAGTSLLQGGEKQEQTG